VHRKKDIISEFVYPIYKDLRFKKIINFDGNIYFIAYFFSFKKYFCK